uniref:Uncharacterized protein n=1 Tax=Arundo donax TaxID=35708 RepID=A0A0A9AJG7_ARUDO
MGNSSELRYKREKVILRFETYNDFAT